MLSYSFRLAVLEHLSRLTLSAKPMQEAEEQELELTGLASKTARLTAENGSTCIWTFWTLIVNHGTSELESVHSPLEAT